MKAMASMSVLAWASLVGPALAFFGIPIATSFVRATKCDDCEEPVGKDPTSEEGTIMVGLNSPWAAYAIKVKALFDGDDEVIVAYNNDEPSLTLYVENAVKADAIAQLFPETVEFGNVSMKIEVLPANDEVTIGDLFAAAFNGNPVFGGVYNFDSMGLKSTFALFAPKAVQYYSDDLREYGGVSTKTYADIARDVFDTDKITENIKISSLHSGNIISY